MKQETEKTLALSSAGARTREELDQYERPVLTQEEKKEVIQHFNQKKRVGELREALRTITARSIPDFDMVMSFAKSQVCGQNKEALIREWFDQCEMRMWTNKDGYPIKSWPYELSMFLYYYNIHKKEADPDRIPDARKARQNNGPNNHLKWKEEYHDDAF